LEEHASAIRENCGRNLHSEAGSAGDDNPEEILENRPRGLALIKRAFEADREKEERPRYYFPTLFHPLRDENTHGTISEHTSLK